MNVTFIGAGYVGLVSGIMMSNFGHNVTCLDNNVEKIALLSEGKLPIYEVDLLQYLTKSIANKTIRFTTDYNTSLRNSEILFITVGTPSLENGAVDLRYVTSAIKRAAKFANKDCLFVIKSTVPPATCNNLALYLQKLGYNFEVASNPEFLREGKGVEDFLKPDRIVIGTDSKRAEEILLTLYAPLINNSAKIVSTDLSTAELIKYSSNAFLAIKVAFINEMANLCEEVGANINELAQGIGADSRIGNKFLRPGPGFGGSCFPKDTLGLAALTKEHKVDLEIVTAAIKANQQRPYDIMTKIGSIFNNNLKGIRLAALGLSFKAGTDDIRESSAIAIIKLLHEQGVIISAYDPKASLNAKQALPNLNICDSLDIAITNTNGIIILTEWEEFQNANWHYIYSHMNDPKVIIDLRNILDINLITKLGFKYYRVGKKDAY